MKGGHISRLVNLRPDMFETDITSSMKIDDRISRNQCLGRWRLLTPHSLAIVFYAAQIQVTPTGFVKQSCGISGVSVR